MVTKRVKRRGFTIKTFSFKLFILISALVMIFWGVKLGKEFYKEYQIQKEIDSLKNDIESLEKSNYKLSQLIEYYKTDEYKEAEARKRLNLKKKGEKVVIIEPAAKNAIENKTEKKNKRDDKLPNYKKWWNYFFATK